MGVILSYFQQSLIFNSACCVSDTKDTKMKEALAPVLKELKMYLRRQTWNHFHYTVKYLDVAELLRDHMDHSALTGSEGKSSCWSWIQGSIGLRGSLKDEWKLAKRRNKEENKNMGYTGRADKPPPSCRQVSSDPSTHHPWMATLSSDFSVQLEQNPTRSPMNMPICLPLLPVLLSHVRKGLLSLSQVLFIFYFWIFITVPLS